MVRLLRIQLHCSLFWAKAKRLYWTLAAALLNIQIRFLIWCQYPRPFRDRDNRRMYYEWIDKAVTIRRNFKASMKGDSIP